MNVDPTEDPAWFSPIARYVPLLIWCGVVAVLAFIPMRIISYGFLPPDDALRHVAKVLSGKTWQEILVLRPGVDIDHNAGWHHILSIVHTATGCGADALVIFSVVSLCVLYFLAPLPFLSRPEAWMATLLASIVVQPTVIFRFCLGRPYILVMATLTVIFFMWLRRGESKPSMALVITTILLMSLAIWVHGGWYLYWLPAAGFFLAQRWRQGFVMTGCWLAASLLAGLYTGRPIFFLEQQFQVLVSCFGNNMLQRMLVVEFKPFDGASGYVMAAVLILIVQAIRGRLTAGTVQNPAFMMAALCWVFGFLVRRFWTDWGTPVFLVWVALQLQDMIEAHVPATSIRRLIMTGMASMAFFLAATSDMESRWTICLSNDYLTTDKKDLEGWLPDPGGIIYSDDMRVFYQTFFKNPTAPWRYILGFEATFMPEEDMAVFRKIQWNFGSYEAFDPWVRKMRPQDRLIVRRPQGALPPIPQLEWFYGASDTWIGRTPRAAVAPSSP